jgi:prepilin-type N-terminal cleavage/methylation domain-containing protein
MKQRGFTLVEIAIVLVIVGLILGGILNSQSLISSMKAKDVVTIVDDLRTASVYFKQRYSYLPGDWPFTTNVIPAVIAAGIGGTIGDGAIEGAIDAATGQAAAGSEVAEAPWQLFNAGFISKIDATDTQRRVKTSYGAVHIASAAEADRLAAGAGFAAANPSARNAIVFANLPCDVAIEVDNKVDDGALATGRAIGTACVNATVAWYAITL